jgi:hypothetical protein
MSENEYIIVVCPHCDQRILIYKNEINCSIFRHAIQKSNGQQINPHATKIECDFLLERDLIYGCGRPFRITYNNDNYVAEICDYI